MPPQPLSRIRPGVGFSLSATGFDKHPAVAQGIAQCIAYWAWVETQMSRLYITLLGGNDQLGVQNFNALESSKGKRDAILTLAVSHLPAEDFKIVEALLRCIKSEQKTRDRIAHWMWGDPGDELSDAMVLVDPKFLLSRSARMNAITRSGSFPSYGDLRISDDDVFVYRAHDLEVDARDFCRLAELTNRVATLCVRSKSGLEYDELRRELANDARLARYLSP